jgi:hypothetical protein
MIELGKLLHLQGAIFWLPCTIVCARDALRPGLGAGRLEGAATRAANENVGVVALDVERGACCRSCLGHRVEILLGQA